LVRKIEYIDANGIPRVINEHDKEFLSAASGCFGLLGVITHLTLQLNPMSYAILRPVKMDVINAIPPPPDMKIEDIPSDLRKDLSPSERAKDQADFERRALTNYYAEWFWFPYEKRMWINTWDNTDNGEGAVEYPDIRSKSSQFVQTFAMQVIQETPVYRWAGHNYPLYATKLISKCARG